MRILLGDFFEVKRERVKCVKIAYKKMIIIFHHEIYSNVRKLMLWQGEGGRGTSKNCGINRFLCVV